MQRPAAERSFAVGVVILAAGRSTRMGRPKLLLPWGETSVLGHLIKQWHSLGAKQIAVVCAAGDNAIQAELDRLGFPARVSHSPPREARAGERRPFSQACSVVRGRPPLQVSARIGAMDLGEQTDPSPCPLPFGRGEGEHPTLGTRMEVPGKRPGKWARSRPVTASEHVVGAKGTPAQDRIINPAPERGMFSSIQCAAQWPGWEAALTHWALVLGDQPHLRPQTLRQVLDFSASHPTKVCQPARRGHGRHPVLLPRTVFRQLARSTATTLKEFLVARSREAALCEADDPGIELDIDRPEDYAKAIELAAKRRDER